VKTPYDILYDRVQLLAGVALEKIHLRPGFREHLDGAHDYECLFVKCRRKEILPIAYWKSVNLQNIGNAILESSSLQPDGWYKVVPLESYHFCLFIDSEVYLIEPHSDISMVVMGTSIDIWADWVGGHMWLQFD